MYVVPVCIPWVGSRLIVLALAALAATHCNGHHRGTRGGFCHGHAALAEVPPRLTGSLGETAVIRRCTVMPQRASTEPFVSFSALAPPGSGLTVEARSTPNDPGRGHPIVLEGMTERGDANMLDPALSTLDDAHRISPAEDITRVRRRRERGTADVLDSADARAR